MNQQSIQKIRNDFDRIAIHEQVGCNHNHRYHKFLLKQLPLHCENVLDIGCSTGAFSCLLAKRCDLVVAQDLSPKMIQVAIASTTHLYSVMSGHEN